jgi:hypothetical protein
MREPGKRYPTPSPEAQGVEVLMVRTRGLSQEDQDGLIVWAEGVWGDDLIVEGSTEEGGTLRVLVRR